MPQAEAADPMAAGGTVMSAWRAGAPVGKAGKGRGAHLQLILPPGRSQVHPLRVLQNLPLLDAAVQAGGGYYRQRILQCAVAGRDVGGCAGHVAMVQPILELDMLRAACGASSASATTHQPVPLYMCWRTVSFLSRCILASVHICPCW